MRNGKRFHHLLHFRWHTRRVREVARFATLFEIDRGEVFAFRTRCRIQGMTRFAIELNGVRYGLARFAIFFELVRRNLGQRPSSLRSFGEHHPGRQVLAVAEFDCALPSFERFETRVIGGEICDRRCVIRGLQLAVTTNAMRIGHLHQ